MDWIRLLCKNDYRNISIFCDYSELLPKLFRFILSLTCTSGEKIAIESSFQTIILLFIVHLFLIILETF